MVGGAGAVVAAPARDEVVEVGATVVVVLTGMLMGRP
jgi:hypothetical protein